MPEQIPEDDWADQDLLTRDAAADRLRTEIARTESELARLRADDPAARPLRDRLLALRGAVAGLQPGGSD
jgi:hypothetical protein